MNNVATFRVIEKRNAVVGNHGEEKSTPMDAKSVILRHELIVFENLKKMVHHGCTLHEIACRIIHEIMVGCVHNARLCDGKKLQINDHKSEKKEGANEKKWCITDAPYMRLLYISHMRFW